MTSFFAMCAVALFAAAIGLFLYRLQFERPPVKPYLVSAAACALGHWTGSEGAPLAGTAILVAVGFLLVHLASAPFSDDEPAG